MVRLKVCQKPTHRITLWISIPVWCDWRIDHPAAANITFGDFNSSMVRLKEKDALLLQMLEDLFQFQYGAIEGHWLCSGWSMCHPCFNSSMVRLKVSDARSYLIDFNDFNSSMVRLKAHLNIMGMTVSYRISIPVWCDWRSPDRDEG